MISGSGDCRLRKRFGTQMIKIGDKECGCSSASNLRADGYAIYHRDSVPNEGKSLEVWKQKCIDDPRCAGFSWYAATMDMSLIDGPYVHSGGCGYMVSKPGLYIPGGSTTVECWYKETSDYI